MLEGGFQKSQEKPWLPNPTKSKLRYLLNSHVVCKILK